MKLYIIGNGFDRHHKMPTGYSDYKVFLSTHYPGAIKAFESFDYLIKESDGDLWSDIESNLTIDADRLISDYIEKYYPDVSSDSDYTFDEMRVEIENLISFVYNFTGTYFLEWISSINSNAYIGNKDLTLDPKDQYITFNYTNTLETIYMIPPKNILHIHGKINTKLMQNIFWGGSYHPAKTMEEAEIMDPIPFPPLNKHTVHSEIQFGSVRNNPSSIENELFNKYSNDEYYGASISQAVDEITNYCRASYKDLEANYTSLKDFLNDKRIDEVIIMGHSFCGIDEPYYTDVFVPVLKDLKWVFYVHDDNSCQEYNCFIDKYSIKNHRCCSWPKCIK